MRPSDKRQGHRRGILIVTAAALIFTASAGAASGPAWTKADMTAAARVLHQPHTGKVSCRGTGQSIEGRHDIFRCTATYKHKPKHRRFFMEGTGAGGWVCAGKTTAACKQLRHGFVAAEWINGLSLEAYTRTVGIGYIDVRYHDQSPSTASGCVPAGKMAWSCGFYLTGSTTPTNIRISYRPVRGGWVTTGSG